MMNLLKILIVDDDATVRIGLKTLIAWEQYGYRLVGEAANGQQGVLKPLDFLVSQSGISPESPDRI